MCKRCFKLLCFVLLMGISSAVPAQNSSANLKRPKLVVGIVVDQMRWDYLYRYYDMYGNDGFRRLLNEGFSCENTFITHLPSYTAVGHSTIYTGSVPAIHGITGNDWTDQLTGKTWYCTDDPLVATVGSSSKAGEMSPRNLLASTITDELRLATNFESRVVGVSLKDRASILPAGHNPTGAFWWDDATGNFITSTWYASELPSWVDKFNKQDVPEKLMKQGWKTLYPLSKYKQSTADDVMWEGTFKGEEKPVFPHDTKALYASDHSNLRSTPYGNSLTLAFAKAALEAYRLGRGAATDFLAINCASTDYVGHKYGPNSIEVEDTYLRLDKELADFMQTLDKEVGKGNYILFLTADHGAAHAINFMKSEKMHSDFLGLSGMVKELNPILATRFGRESLILSAQNEHINLNESLIASAQLDRDAIKKMIVEFLRKQPGIQFVVDLENPGSAAVPEPLKSMLINGYYSKRCGPIAVVGEPGYFNGGKTGTTHGSWNPYDSHIPLIFMGWNIPHGYSNKTRSMTDIAPTLAALLHIQMPNGSIGHAIEEVTNPTH